MPKTLKQKLGFMGEVFVSKICSCPRCKKKTTFRCLPANFKCADIICDFCGCLAQVKSKNVLDLDMIPDSILGAAWKPQAERMQAGVYFPLFLVLVADKKKAIYFLSADLQAREIFVSRNPLKETARRAGWQGFTYDLKNIKNRLIRLY